jgi:hypothetical protein
MIRFRAINYFNKKVFKHLACKDFIEPYIKEFDPGSGRTLAARLTHASRTV